MPSFLNERPPPGEQTTDTVLAELASLNATDASAPGDFLKFLERSISVNQDFMADLLRARWQRSLRAYRNQHFVESKYLTSNFAHRSKVFRPKTRTAVRKNMAAAATALFSADDVVKVTAEYQDNDQSEASAKVIHAALNYRLDRTSARGGIPWFLTAMGAQQQSQIHGICVSKQSWEYEVRPRQRPVQVAKPMIGPDGVPAIDPMTGQPQIEMAEEMEAFEDVIRDRPMIYLIPVENIILDLSAPWYSPIQDGAYFSVKYPMTVGEVRAMIESNSTGQKGGGKWLDVPAQLLRSGSLSGDQNDYDAKAVRQAREDSQDRYDISQEEIDPDYGIVWIYENFIKSKGLDYHYWSVGTRAYLSEVVETGDAYPAFKGGRPYHMGFGAIEAHSLVPMSNVESWQQLQQEANDLVNLRLDVVKQALAPIAMVRRGSTFDLERLKNRSGPETTILVDKLDDLAFADSPGVRGEAFAEMTNLNADFDDASGTFSQGSIQTNRTLNETVGGMRLLSGAANATTEFDLRVWTETWVEPVLRQIVHLEQYYESDQVVLAIAGQKAKLLEKYGISEITDEMLTREVNLKVNVGIGATDPMQGLQKLGMAVKMIGDIGPAFDIPPKVKSVETIAEIMSKAGYSDGLRFFNLEPQPQGPDPAVMAEQIKADVAKQKIQADLKIAEQKNDNNLDVAMLKGMVSVLDSMLSAKTKMSSQEMSIASSQIELILDHMRAQQEAEQARQAAEQDRQMQIQQAAAAGPPPGGGPPLPPGEAGPPPSLPSGGPPADGMGGPPSPPPPAGAPPGGPPPGANGGMPPDLASLLGGM